MILRQGRQKGFSLIELLIVVAIILIIAGIAIPNLMKSKIQANEAAAVETLRTLDTSMVMYSTTYGGYPHALADMGPSAGGATSSAAADLIDVVLATGVKGGYRYGYVVAGSDQAGHVLGYTITALPISPGVTGQRSFFTDQSGTIRSTLSGPADATSTPIG